MSDNIKAADVVLHESPGQLMELWREHLGLGNPYTTRQVMEHREFCHLLMLREETSVIGRWLVALCGQCYGGYGLMLVDFKKVARFALVSEQDMPHDGGECYATRVRAAFMSRQWPVMDIACVRCGHLARQSTFLLAGKVLRCFCCDYRFAFDDTAAGHALREARRDERHTKRERYSYVGQKPFQKPFPPGSTRMARRDITRRINKPCAQECARMRKVTESEAKRSGALNAVSTAFGAFRF